METRGGFYITQIKQLQDRIFERLLIENGIEISGGQGSRGRFKYEGIMLTGTMEVLQDHEIKQEIWRTGDIMFYRKGVTDPDYCVLKFTAVKGRYYCDLKTESFDFEDLK